MNSTARIFLCGATRAATKSINSFAVASPLNTTKAFGTSPASSSGTGNHSGIGDVFVREQQGFQLGGRHLEPFVLDQLLRTIDDEEMSIRIGITNVAGVKPMFRIDCLQRLLPAD